MKLYGIASGNKAGASHRQSAGNRVRLHSGFTKLAPPSGLNYRSPTPVPIPQPKEHEVPLPFQQKNNTGNTVSADSINCHEAAAATAGKKFHTIDSDDNLIITLTTVPPRVMNDTFVVSLRSLFQQHLKPKCVVLNVCKKYRRQFEYPEEEFYQKLEKLQDTFPDLYVNWVPDYGPATKLIGLLHLPPVIELHAAKVIVVDDDIAYSSLLTSYYMLAMQMYSCDVVAIDESEVYWNPKLIFQQSQYLFRDKYCGFLCGWLSFCVLGKHIPVIRSIVEKIVTEFPATIKHDDVLFTAAYRAMKLYAVQLQFEEPLQIVKSLDEIGPLRCMDGDKTQLIRRQLEAQVMQYMGIPYKVTAVGRVVLQRFAGPLERVFPEEIAPRTLLRGVRDLVHLLDENLLQLLHWDVFFFSKDLILITVTLWEEQLDKDHFVFTFSVSSVRCQARIRNPKNGSGRFTVVLRVPDIHVEAAGWPTANIELFQVWMNADGNQSALVSLKKSYSICTFLCQLPYLPYKLYTNHTAEKYILERYNPSLATQILHCMRNLNVGAYLADTFRAIRGLDGKCLYVDCKKVLHCGEYLSNEITDGDYMNCSLALDRWGGICNNLLLLKTANIPLWKKYTAQLLCNLRYENYCENNLAITGPQLLGKIGLTHSPPPRLPWYYSVGPNDDSHQSTHRTLDGNKVMSSNSYPGYYHENNYIQHHYSVLHTKRQVYRNLPPPKHTYPEKLRGVDGIAYLNLRRSPERDCQMRILLQPITCCPHHRIEAVDVAEQRWISTLPQKENSKHSDLQIAQTLSHLKALTFLLRQPGDVFLVLQDNVTFWTWEWLHVGLPTILRGAPENWEILKLHKRAPPQYFQQPQDIPMYIPAVKESPYATTYAYLVTREALRKITSYSSVDCNNRVTFRAGGKLTECNDLLHDLCGDNMYDYRYNLCEPNLEESSSEEQQSSYNRVCEEAAFRFLLEEQLCGSPFTAANSSLVLL